MSLIISIVIPTRNRAELLRRALTSVFNQTVSDIEVIVVVDGPDDATIAMLAGITDHRLRWIVNPTSLTAAGARNAGVQQARGPWIAFLDDDDEWLPQKLELQLRAVPDNAPETANVLVTCRSFIITPKATFAWPTTLYEGHGPLDEYLFDRKSTFSGTAFIQTSSYLLPRSVALTWKFRTDTPHDDWDFILRVSKLASIPIITVPDVLVRFYAEEHRPSLSSVGAWSASLDWLNENRNLFTRRGYAGFCLCVVGPRAAQDKAYGAFLPLLLCAFRAGAPRPLHVLAYVAFWLISQDLRRRLRAVLSNRHVAR